jgi:tripartite-type tricarboxylate transporter receptor subunit TctC
MTTLARRALFATFAGLLAAPLAAQEAPWPQAKPVQLLVGFAPGGALDAITRVLAEGLKSALGQSVVVENRTGAVGAIAARAVATARPDGYTLLALPGPILHARPVPQVGGELAPITLFARGPMVIAGPAAMGLPDLAAVIAEAKRAPEKWNFGTAGVGSSHHIAGTLLNERAGTRITHLPYRGGGPIITDLLANRLTLAVSGAGPLLPQIEAGNLRAYAVTTAARFSGLPDTPTLAEVGFAGVDLSQWFGLAGPAGLPPAITDRLNAEIGRLVARTAIREAIARQGMEAATTTPAAFAAFVATENKLYEDLRTRFAITIE